MSTLATTEANPYTMPGIESYRLIKRNGELVSFDPRRIELAIKKAFVAVEGTGSEQSNRIHELAIRMTNAVCHVVMRRSGPGGTIHIEAIQDQVELALMREGEHKVARAYVIYREKRAEERRAMATEATGPQLRVSLENGGLVPLDLNKIRIVVREACEGLSGVSAELILESCLKSIYDGVTEKELAEALVLSARQLIEKEPDYTYAAARLLLHNARREALSHLSGSYVEATQAELGQRYAEYFVAYLNHGIKLGHLDERLAEFDLPRICAAIAPERDMKFTLLGLQTLYDRYLLHDNDTRYELPQAMLMRVAMGLALNEVDREGATIAFYDVLSKFEFMSSTPTLFNSGTRRPQLSSCFLTTVPDDLDSIFGSIKDNALLAKYSGGIGNDWTPVRGMGAHIKGTNGKSQGVVPFMKVANDTAVAVNQGGKRKGAVCGYLETWHIDIEEFLDLRKNTGDDRRRTHDMNTANWIPDLFMKRVLEGGKWCLFSPDECPDLHDKVGKSFEAAYTAYEEKARNGEMRVFKEVEAISHWRKMLQMLFETGHPWVTFKDPCNLRSPQQHVGVVHSSNLCTEITLNTSRDEVAVCNLGSINLAEHVTEQGLDEARLKHTIAVAMRMLDNVIDINYYTIPQARRSNLKHRPVGLGIMGFQDALYKLRLSYSSNEAVEFADRSMEVVSYWAIHASTDLAAERGAYASFKGSLWSRGILPMDSIDILTNERGKQYIDVDRSATLDWASLRERVKTVGMRNSNTMAIAPTATISNICGVSQSIEPMYQNLFVKSNMSGEFTVVNPYLAHDLKARGLWDDAMVSDLKYYDGRLDQIDRVPDDLKELYQTAFEIAPKWLVEAASRRQKWIDQAQSLNLYMAAPSGKAMDELYRHAWLRGLKTTYYLRSMGATHAEKSTMKHGKLNAVPTDTLTAPGPKACSISDPDCEACQ